MLLQFCSLCVPASSPSPCFGCLGSFGTHHPQEMDGQAVPGLRGDFGPLLLLKGFERLKAPHFGLKRSTPLPFLPPPSLRLVSCFSRKDGMEWPARISVFLLHAAKTKQTHTQKKMSLFFFSFLPSLFSFSSYLPPVLCSIA